MTQSDVFKFVAIRPTSLLSESSTKQFFIKDSRKPELTPVGKLILKLNGTDKSRLAQIIKEFISKNKFYLEYLDRDGNNALDKIYDFAKKADSDFAFINLIEGVKAILGKRIEDYSKDKFTKELQNNLWDRYYSFLILSRSHPQNLEPLIKSLRSLNFINYLSLGNKIENKEVLKNIISANLVVDPVFTDISEHKVQQKKVLEENKSDQAVKNKYKQLWQKLIDVHNAIKEVQGIKFDNKVEKTTKEFKTLNRETGRTAKSKITVLNSSVIVSKEVFSKLNPETKNLLRKESITEKNIKVPDAVNILNNKFGEVFNELRNINDPKLFYELPDEAKSIPAVFELINSGTKPAKKVSLEELGNAIDLLKRSMIRPLGIGDLKVVKQKLKKYVAGEVAHIENVLKGESKIRDYRVLNRTEDIFSVSNSTEEETAKDTQTTERFELKKESEKSISEKMSMQAGVTVSASYGMVTLGAHADFGYETSKEESSKNASNFAREVIDKSLSRIQKKTLEERTTKRLHEVEEINKHELDNVAGKEHISGIYRWVDKYYEAQIYNYGVRLMFEFIIPEPANFYSFSTSSKNEKSSFSEPDPIEFSFKDINEFNYQEYIKKYNVHGVLPPPPLYKKITTCLTKGEMVADDTAHILENKELLIPEGYESDSWVSCEWSALCEYSPKLSIAIGYETHVLVNNTLQQYSAQLNHSEDSSPWTAPIYYSGTVVPVTVNSYCILSYNINITITCKLTWQKSQEWQIQTFEKIMAAYQIAKGEYDQKIKAEQNARGVNIQGRNPGINRDIEKTELKKQCLKLLMNSKDFGKFNSMQASKDPDTWDDFDVFDSMNEGKIIQFFEQAFEWENLTYLFYPYFWGRSTGWVEKSKIYDTDPIFTKFLQAGAARVVVPVTMPYYKAVMYFMGSGKIWSGGEPPVIGDPLYVSLDEVWKNQTDDLGDATPEGDPWEVIVPTTLVYLQPTSDLPTFE